MAAVAAKLVCTLSIVLLLISGVQSQQECNAYRFFTTNVAQCGQQWLKDTAAENEVPDDMKVSKTIANYLLPALNLTENAANAALKSAFSQIPGFPDINIFQRIVESVLITEPYIVYLAADVVQAFGQRANLGLHTEPKAIYEKYFDVSCSRNLGSSFTMCVKGMIPTICNRESNMTGMVDSFLKKVSGHYCKDGKLDPEIKAMLGRDFGRVIMELFVSLGLNTTNVQSNLPLNMLSNIGSTTPSVNLTFVLSSMMGLNSQMIADYKRACGHIITSVEARHIDQYFNSSSNLTVVEVVKFLSKLYDRSVKCRMSFINKWMPRVANVMKHSRFVNLTHMVMGRYSLAQNMPGEMPDFGKNKTVVGAISHPHLLIYNSSTPQACPARGLQTYLDNENFTIYGNQSWSNLSCALCTAPKINEIMIHFKHVPQSSGYINFTHSMRRPSSPYIPGVKVEDKGNVTVMTHEATGTIIYVGSSKDSNFLIVNGSETVYEQSLGLLITGCPDPTNITTIYRPTETHKQACSVACRNISMYFTRTCESDCLTKPNATISDTYNILEGIFPANRTGREPYPHPSGGRRNEISGYLTFAAACLLASRTVY